MTQDKQPAYKSTTTHFFQMDLGQFLVAELHASVNNPEWLFKVFSENRLAWEGTLQELVETILLGRVYQGKLTIDAQRGEPCEATSPSTTPTSVTEPSNPEESDVPF